MVPAGYTGAVALGPPENSAGRARPGVTLRAPGGWSARTHVCDLLLAPCSQRWACRPLFPCPLPQGEVAACVGTVPGPLWRMPPEIGRIVGHQPRPAGARFTGPRRTGGQSRRARSRGLAFPLPLGRSSACTPTHPARFGTRLPPCPAQLRRLPLPCPRTDRWDLGEPRPLKYLDLCERGNTGPSGRQRSYLCMRQCVHRRNIVLLSMIHVGWAAAQTGAASVGVPGHRGSPGGGIVRWLVGMGREDGAAGQGGAKRLGLRPVAEVGKKPQGRYGRRQQVRARDGSIDRIDRRRPPARATRPTRQGWRGRQE